MILSSSSTKISRLLLPSGILPLGPPTTPALVSRRRLEVLATKGKYRHRFLSESDGLSSTGCCRLSTMALGVWEEKTHG